MRTADGAATIAGMSRTVLIVDDHGPYRVSARAMLEAEGFVVVGEAGSGADALTQADALKPAVVLLDIQLPDHDGFEVAERLAGSAHPPAVVLISSRSAQTYAARLIGARARGFITKSQLSGAAITALLE